jgi:hypothetical protein
MKAGTGNKTEVRIAIVLVIVAIMTVTWALMPRDTTASQPAPIAATPALASPAKGTAAQASDSLDPRLHLDWLANSESVKYEGKGTNIFRAAAETIKIDPVKVPPLTRQQQLAKLNTPPPPPPITLKFFGISNSRGERPKAFLSQGDDVWIAHEGDVVDRHYKIVRISPNAVEVEDLLNNNRQSIQLTQG